VNLEITAFEYCYWPTYSFFYANDIWCPLFLLILLGLVLQNLIHAI